MMPQDNPPAGPDSASSSPAETPDAANDLQAALRSQRILFQVTLVALILALGSVNVLFFHQIRGLRAKKVELQSAGAELSKSLGGYITNGLPMVERLSTELGRFAERNPDFAPIYAKYTGSTNLARPANLPAGPSAESRTNTPRR